MSLSIVPVKIRQAWDAIPDVGCKGLCWEYCGPVDASPQEKAILRANGLDLDAFREGWLARIDVHAVVRDGDFGTVLCPALKDGRCSVYEVRPAICRLWGATDQLPCPHGCAPKGRTLLSAVEAGQIIMGLGFDE